MALELISQVLAVCLEFIEYEPCKDLHLVDSAGIVMGPLLNSDSGVQIQHAALYVPMHCQMLASKKAVSHEDKDNQ